MKSSVQSHFGVHLCVTRNDKTLFYPFLGHTHPTTHLPIHWWCISKGRDYTMPICGCVLVCLFPLPRLCCVPSAVSCFPLVDPHWPVTRSLALLHEYTAFERFIFYLQTPQALVSCNHQGARQIIRKHILPNCINKENLFAPFLEGRSSNISCLMK